MVKKAIDSRIPALIRNGAQEKKRSFFVVVGDRQKDVIVNLYHILLNVDIKLNKKVLWAYKNKLIGFTSHRQKREKKIKKEIKRGIRDADTDDPFELFVSTQDIRYVYYKETDKVLGNTYSMCILQDFEALTPNLLARTVETVEGGGLVILLLKGMNSLKQLYTLSMDVHSRYRTEAHSDVVARFNERFILSLGSCESCLVVDDELNVLPISGGKTVQPLPPPEADEQTPQMRELSKLKDELAETQPVGSLVSLAKTVDQARALLTFVDAIEEKTLQSTVALTAARGRGKSAAMGVAIAAAVAHGYSNIFITSPSPENLRTLFDFVFKGFDSLGYMDHVDYDIIQSTNPDFNKAVVRVNVHKHQHRQTIQYIQPQDAHVLGQAELVVIDEAAAIPLPLVKKLMGPYLIFMASTINGYEGTGRSLSLKLISQLREQSSGSGKANGAASAKVQEGGSSIRSLREITLAEPIRYAAGDSVEKWLNKVLCLDATLPKRSLSGGGNIYDPAQCELLAVNRDTLFSFHTPSEKFLHRMLSLYVASHYKNSPNDLQLMSDAPAHHLYALVPPVQKDGEGNDLLPEPLVVIQVALEGQISKQSVMNSLSRGQRASGDLIPWTISQQFQDDEFAGLSGARIVRIATNPDYASMGYGARALQLLIDFYSGKFTSLSETDEDIPYDQQQLARVSDEELEAQTLHKADDVKVRDISKLPPLFSRLSEIRPPALDYLGVSYGLTPPLHKFWKRAHFVPVYLRQTANELTGEHTCIMLRTIQKGASDALYAPWLRSFADDFHERFVSLLAGTFKSFTAILALELDQSASAAYRADSTTSPPLTLQNLDATFRHRAHDLARLEAYASNTLDYHVILDLVPKVAALFFSGPLRSHIRLSGVQSALLLAIGCQFKDMDQVARELGLTGPQDNSQLLAMFVKLLRKVTAAFRAVLEAKVAQDMPGEHAGDVDDEAAAAPAAADDDGTERAPHRFGPVAQSVDAELAEAADGLERAADKERARAMIDALPLERYAAGGGGADAGADADWADAERMVDRGSGRVSVKKRDAGAAKRKAGEAVGQALKELEREPGEGKRKKGKKH